MRRSNGRCPPCRRAHQAALARVNRAKARGTYAALPGPQAHTVLEVVQQLRAWLDAFEADVSPGSGTAVKKIDGKAYIDVAAIYHRLLTGRRLLNPAAAIAEHHGLDS